VFPEREERESNVSEKEKKVREKARISDQLKTVAKNRNENPRVWEAEMASPQSERLAITPSSSKPLSITPGSRVLKTPLTDEAIWKRLRDAGFDEESIKRRDKAALIAYIAKLEAEVSYFPLFFFFAILFYINSVLGRLGGIS
jgi:hypothetical protein